MSKDGKVVAAAAGMAASLLTGLGASPDRELVFFLLAGACAGFLYPGARRWVESTPRRVLAGSALGFLACYSRFAPWVGASLPAELHESWAITVLSLIVKAVVVFAVVEGLYARLREDGVIGT